MDSFALCPRSSRLLVGLILTAALAAPTSLRAAEPPTSQSTPGASSTSEPDEEDLDPSAGTKRKALPDTRFGHVYVDARFGLSAPAGLFSAAPEGNPNGAVAVSNVLSTGTSFGGIVGLGISRFTVLEASGAYTSFSSPSVCSDCKGQSFDFGLGLSYHLAHGIAIDPWGSFGLGLRMATVTAPPPRESRAGRLTEQTYRGLDIARIAFGVDFYPTPFLGIGPYVEADIGTAFSRPDPTLSPGAYAFFQLGVRIAFDPFRSSNARPQPSHPLTSARR